MGGSLGISQASGYIFSDPAAQDEAVPGSHRADQDYAASNQAQAQVHFEFGSAVLTPNGREILRIMCANELVALSSSGSSLVISSQADRVDTDQRNLDLSTMRAQNTLQAIKDVMGSALGIPDSRITLRGLGEQGAKEAGDADHTKNPARRKSDVVLNSRLVATLFGKQ
ncbi:MAG TPA: OmpA family protein [Polyangiaceae bacterium]|nr:OmpA family protein [Polyangiaceae bacterium]